MSITQLADYDQELFILKDGEALVDRCKAYTDLFGWTTAVVAPLVTSVAAFRHNATNNNSFDGAVVGWAISFTSSPPGYWKNPSFHEGFMSPAYQHFWVRGISFLFMSFCLAD